MRTTCLALALACALAGCVRPAHESRAVKIGLVPMGTTDPYWQAVHAGASRAGAELGIEVLWPTAFRVGDIRRQIEAIDDMRRRGATAIAIAPINPTTLIDTLDALIQAGIPAVVFDARLERENVPFIGSDNRRAGRLAAEHLIETLGGRGGVIVVRPDSGASSVGDRVDGFLEVMAEHPAMTIVDVAPVGAGLEPAFVRSHEILKATGAREAGRVAGVFTPTQTTTVGMVRALENFKLTRQIVHVGFDTSPLLANLLRRRDLDALVLQDPDAMGRLSVVTLMRMIRGEPAERRTATQLAVATPDTADRPEISALLKPNLTIIR